MPSQHAVLSASSSNRWIHCTPSARLEERVPEQASIYAAEGTVAHAKAEKKLTNWKEGHPRRKVKCEDGEMDEATTAYRDYVVEVFNEEKKKCAGTELYVEVQLDLTPWIPDGFGTADAIVVSDDTLHVIDLKYGKGVPVDAPHNSQLMLYGAGALNQFEMYFDFDQIKLHIFQPRLDHISTYDMYVDDLTTWLAMVVKPSADMAWKGEGKQKPGEWCRFCKVKGNCKARAEQIKQMNERYKQLDAMLLTDEEVAQILPMLPDVKAWTKDIEEFALSQALNGTHYEGYKVVEGTSRRKIVKPDEVMGLLAKEGYKDTEYMKAPELKTITALEKLVGKKHFSEITEGCIEKPQGKPVLVPVTDKRPEWQSGIDDFKDEKEED